MSIKTRIWILSVIDVMFILGLVVLLEWGKGEQNVAIIAALALIAYITWSILRLRKQAAK